MEWINYYKSKVKSIIDEQIISDAVYNSAQKIVCNETNFMTELDILKVIKTIKPKNCVGHNHITLGILLDGIKTLSSPLSILFNKIHDQKKVPEQWLNSKVIPIHKWVM